MESKPNADEVASSIKDKTFIIEQSGNQEKKVSVIDLDEKEKDPALDAIQDAINKIREG